MAESVVKSEVIRSLTPSEGGVHTTAVAWGANLAEKALAIPIGVGRAARNEAFRAVYAGIDWVEGTNQAAFKIVRQLVQRLDELSLEFVEGLESVASAGSTVIRSSGEAAGEMISKTAASLMGKRETVKVA